MNKSKIEKRLPEPQHSKEQKADGLPSALLLPNPMLCVRQSPPDICPYDNLSIGILQEDGSIKPTSFLYKNIREFLRQRSLGMVDT